MSARQTGIPAFLFLGADDDAEIIRTEDATRANVETALRATDSRETAASLRWLLRMCGELLSGSTTVGQVLADDPDWGTS